MQGMEEREKQLAEAFKSSLRTILSFLPWRNFSVNEVAKYLAREIVATVRADREGRSFAPDQYTLSIHPRGTGELETAPPNVQRQLGLELQRVLEQLDFTLAREPHITLATDPTLNSGEVRVIAWHSSDPLQLTEEIEASIEEVVEVPPPNAFLVIEGRRHYPLTKSVVTIGRLLDNDLVLDDPHVSRRHAQLRARNNNFVLVDLRSTVGTRVNGRLIRKHILNPGDVISIARIELIYGEDPGGPPDVTPPYEPTSKPPTDRHQVTPLDMRTRPHDSTSSFEPGGSKDSS
jgi:pSer/pThr/pTyr-binding forkhead associated (FHA) protein